jgi:hypothetical protein
VDICETCRSIQVDTPLLGVAHRRLSFGGSAFDASGLNLVGMGREATSIEYDPAGGGGAGNPPTLTTPDDADLFDELLDLVESSRR